ncbi:glutathione S-transferase N-terminal domain-containing protein [Candidatus Micrarchaeota archaeon]|nr:glutathione S-transferase N-terminal domain-containing protein [Candidatus Micrarchaeota archaeon]
MANNVIVYSAVWCPWCTKVKEFLDSHKIKYEVRDVDNEKFAQEVVTKSGQGGIPVTDVDGTIVVGFDVKKLKELLSIK